jgi:hypothetical protein
MIYNGLCGEHIEMSAQNAIALAAKHNCKVRIKFNGVSIVVNKRLSVEHVARTYKAMIKAEIMRYRRRLHDCRVCLNSVGKFIELGVNYGVKD